MKKHPKFILLLLASMLFCFPAFSQDVDDPPPTLTSTITITSGKKTDTGELLLRSNSCWLHVKLEVYMANIFQPLQFPDLGVEVTLEDQLGNIAVSTNFKFNHTDFEQLPGTYGPVGEIAYLAKLILPIDISAICGQHQEGTSISLTSSSKLLISTDGINYSDFPVCDYNGMEELFSCHVFDNISCDDGECLASNDNIVEQGSMILNCLNNGDCGSNSGGDGHEGDGRQGQTQYAQQIMVFPNPFEDRIQVELPEATSLKQIELYDANGKVIISRNSNKGLESSRTLFLETAHLPRGIYFLKIETASKIQTLKFFKLK